MKDWYIELMAYSPVSITLHPGYKNYAYPNAVSL